MQYPPSLIAALSLFMVSCGHVSPPEPRTNHAPPTARAAQKPVRVPDFILRHWPGIGWKTSVSIYHGANGYKLIAERWLEYDCHKKWNLRVTSSEAVRLAELLTILNPHDLPEEDICHIPVRDGTSWTVMTDIATTHISRTRQTTANPKCATFQSAVEEIMAFVGLTCTGRGCFSQREMHDHAKVCE